ncbi:MAG: gluconate 2-dehydrogenase subunit 3 family protein [Myxococcales bacterium]
MAAPEPPPTLSRRRLLKSGLWGGALIALSGVGLSLQKTRRPAKTPEHLSVLSRDEYAVLVAIADTLCPRRSATIPSASELGIPEQVDAMFATADADQREGFKLALRVVESPVGGALFGERVVPFSQLDEAGRGRALRALRDSRLGVRRTIYTGISSLIMAHYWGNPRSWARIGYADPNVQGLRDMYRDNLVDLSSLRGPTPGKGS